MVKLGKTQCLPAGLSIKAVQRQRFVNGTRARLTANELAQHNSET